MRGASMLLLLLLLPLLLLLRCLLAEWRRRARGRQRGETRDLPARIVQSLDAVALCSRSTLDVSPHRVHLHAASLHERAGDATL